MQTRNCLKIILYEYKFTENPTKTEYGNFTISITFNSKTCTTKKININLNTKFTSENIFYFDIPEDINDKLSILIDSISTSWMIFNTVICSCEINYKKNISNFNGIARWFSMKNKENKEIMKILISISNLTDENIEEENPKLLDIPVFNTKDSFINKISNNNASFTNNDEFIPIRLNNTIIGKTHIYNNGTKNSNPKSSTNDLFLHLYSKTNHVSFIKQNNNNRNYKKKNTFNNNKNDIFCSLDENYKKFINNNEKNEEKIDLNQIIFLIEKYKNEGGNKNILSKFYGEIKSLKEKEEKLEKEKLFYEQSIKELKGKNEKLDKERQLFQDNLSKFYDEKKELEEKNLKLIKNIKDYENERDESNKKEKIYINCNNIYYNLNYYISTGNSIPLSKEENKIYLKNKRNELVDSLNTDNDENI